VKWMDTEQTDVTFNFVEDEWIQHYLKTGVADDKAGGYGVQETGTTLIKCIDGDISNVIGLPLDLLHAGLKENFDMDIGENINFEVALSGEWPVIKDIPQRH